MGITFKLEELLRENGITKNVLAREAKREGAEKKQQSYAVSK